MAMASSQTVPPIACSDVIVTASAMHLGYGGTAGWQWLPDTPLAFAHSSDWQSCQYIPFGCPMYLLGASGIDKGRGWCT